MKHTYLVPTEVGLDAKIIQHDNLLDHIRYRLLTYRRLLIKEEDTTVNLNMQGALELLEHLRTITYTTDLQKVEHAISIIKENQEDRYNLLKLHLGILFGINYYYRCELDEKTKFQIAIDYKF